MRSAIAVLAVISLIHAQPSLLQEQDCKENESFTTCGSACEPSCDRPSQTFCTLQCVIGCQCDEGFVRNANKECVKPEQCNAVNSTVPTATGAGPTSTPMNCPVNETYNECHNPCTERKCPVKHAPLVNCLMMCQLGCGCSKGYMRNNKGQCVLQNDCPPIDSANSTQAADENPCNLVDCRSGKICKLENGEPKCVDVSDSSSVKPSTACHTVRCSSGFVCRDVQGQGRCVPAENSEPTLTCANVRCGTPGGCAMVEQQGCGNRRCRAQPSCVNSNPCATTLCKDGTECVLRQVTCVRAPCDPIAECVAPSRANRSAEAPDNFCPLNEETVPCKNACSDQKCGETDPRMCPEVCLGPGCACKSGFFRDNSGKCVTQAECDSQAQACAATSCLVGSQCVVRQVQCFTTPCPPVVGCEPIQGSDNSSSTCPQFEKEVACKNECSEKACGQTEVKACTKICLGPGCACLDGFFRDSNGKCVTQNECEIQALAQGGGTRSARYF